MGFEDAYKQYLDSEKGKAVASLYDTQKESTLAGLESAYQANLSNAQAARDKLPDTYRAQANDLAAQYERNRRNLNQQAAANGINTGTASQQQLALNNAWQRNYGGVKTAEANAIAEADRGITNLGMQYQNEMRQALANSDYQKAAALLQNYKDDYSQKISLAQQLAQYGDFSGYQGIYSEEQINQMRSAWIAANPDLAYNTGAIDDEQYKKIAGKYPPGSKKRNSGGGGGYSYSGGGTGNGGKTKNPSGNKADNPAAEADVARRAKEVVDTLVGLLEEGQGGSGRPSRPSLAVPR
jgi:hypothetical protein